MRFFITGVTIIFLASCSGTSLINKQLSGSDSLVINFTTPQSGTTNKSVTTTEVKAIEKLSSFVDGKKTELYKCGYNGNLLFFSKGKLLNDISFNYSEPGCQHFIFSIDSKLMSTKMENEAIDFLKSLAEGKDWY